MWKEVSKQEFESGSEGWNLIHSGQLFSGGEFSEYGQKDAYWRTETKGYTVRYFQFVWSN